MLTDPLLVLATIPGDLVPGKSMHQFPRISLFLDNEGSSSTGSLVSLTGETNQFRTLQIQVVMMVQIQIIAKEFW